MGSAEALAAVVEAGGAHVPSVMTTLERRLLELAESYGPTLGAHASATISAGGKRLRPLLVFLTAGEGADSARLVRAGAAVELVHSASLVHDDVLDRAQTRRGRPTVVAAGGRLAAVATGDMLFSCAFRELAGNASVAQVRVLTEAAGALVRGELLQRQDAWDAGVSRERYFERCELKTAQLFEASCRLGAIEGGLPEAPLAAFGRRIGLAFQLLDDVLDVSGPMERTGKQRGTDLLDGTVTLPLIEARGRDPRLRELDVRAVRDAPEAERVCDAIAATGALDAVREQALELITAAKRELPPLPDAQLAVLELVADGVVDRYS